MNRIAAILYDYRAYLILALSLLVSVGVMASDDNRQVRTIQAATLDAFRWLQAPVQYLGDLRAIRGENRELRQKTVELAMRNSQFLAAQIENRRLRELLGFKERGQLNYLTAEITASNTAGLINSVTLDVGREAGVRENMPIVTPLGVAGKIVAPVGRRSSIAQLLLDRNFRLSVKIQHSGTTGILVWREGMSCELHEVPKSADIQVGNEVLTSGYSDIFPPDLPVGTIVSVEDDAVGFFKVIRVEPKVRFTELEEVFVILPRQIG